MSYPGDDGGEQLQVGGEPVHLSLGDPAGGRVAVEGGGLRAGEVPTQVLVVQHQRVKQQLPGHRPAGHALQVVPWVVIRKTQYIQQSHLIHVV